MSLQIVCGTSGSGKTSWCFQQMKSSLQAGKNVILIVPEQVSLSAENQAIDALGYLGNGREVLSFGRLFYRIYQLCDGRKRNYVDNIGKAMLLNRIITEEQSSLLLYGSIGKPSNLSSELLATISELKRHNVSPDTLMDTSQKIEQSGTGYKLHDIAYLFDKYQQRVADQGFDSEDNLTLLKNLIPDCALLQHTDIFIDSFSGFTAQEYDVISELIRTAPNVFITLCTDLSNQPLFDPVNRTREKLSLLAHGNQNPDIRLTQNHRHQSEDLLFLEQHYGRYPQYQYLQKPENISIELCDTPYQEVDHLARNILALVREDGYRFSDIGVITGDIKGYAPILDHSFRQHGIACFLDQKHGIMTHPVCLFLLSLCDIFLTHFSYESVFAFLKTNLTGIPMEEIDLLENYVLETGIKGNAWQKEWEYRLDESQKETINHTRRAFLDLVMPFRDHTKGRNKAETFVSAIKEFMEQVRLCDQIEEITVALTNEGRYSLALEYRQVYNLLISALDQMIICLGDLSFGIEKFRDMFASGLSQCEIGVIPPTCDGVVCGSFERSKHHHLKVLFLLGGYEGCFPPVLTGTGLITDAERRLLEKNNLAIAPDNRKKALEQPFLLYELLSAPSEKLIISYPLSNQKGEGLRPSSVLSYLKEMFPLITLNDTLNPEDDSLVSSPSATLSQLAIHQARGPVWQQVLNWYQTKPIWKDKAALALSGKNYRISAGIEKEIAQMIWGNQLNTTVTRLESYAQCPFSFFLKYGLKLKERKKYSFSAPDAGNIIHKIMEDFSNYVSQNHLSWDTLDKDFCIQKVSELTDKLVAETTAKMPLVSSRHRFLISRLRQASATAMWAVIRHIKAGIFKPYAVEYSIGNPGAVPPLERKTPSGNKMILYGKIDRIDTGEGLFRIIDYKSSRQDLDLSKVYQGAALQLFVYSAALRNQLGEVGGMFYLAVDSPLIEYKQEMTAQEIEQKVLNSLNLNGYMVGDEEMVLKMDEEINGYSGIVSARSTKNGIFTTRLLSPKQYDGLAQAVLSHAARYADEILDGNCSILPLAEGQTSACTYCSYRAVCGFEPKNNSCRRLKNLTRQEILDAVSGEEGDHKNEQR